MGKLAIFKSEEETSKGVKGKVRSIRGDTSLRIKMIRTSYHGVRATTLIRIHKLALNRV